MNTQILERLPRSFQVIFQAFFWIGRVETVENLQRLMLGWILNTGRQTVSRVLVALQGNEQRRHHSALYRLLAGASWSVDDLGEALFVQLLPFLPKEITVPVDDTLCRKTGPFLFGGGMHRDEKGSTGGGKRVRFSFGHNFVVLSVWVPLPWRTSKGIAVPVLTRLYRSLKTCPKSEYRKRTELANEMLRCLAGWIEDHAPNHQVLVVGDSEYACKTLVQSLPQGFQLAGPMRLDAALWEPLPRVETQISGRPRKKGPRLPRPQEIADDLSLPWQNAQLDIYGKSVQLQMKHKVVLWYRVGGPRPVLMVLTRDPRGKLQDRAYFTTQTESSLESLVQTIAKRWAIEVTFRDTKQHLGLEDPQNGFRRRKTKKGRKPGPQPYGKKGYLAVTRTAPTLFATYGWVWLWYLRFGNPRLDVALARAQRPWDRDKAEPSFADVLNAARRELATAGVSEDPLGMRILENSSTLKPRAKRAA